MKTLLDEQDLLRAAECIPKMHQACRRYRPQRLTSEMIPTIAFTKQPGEQPVHFSDDDARAVAQGVIAVGDQGNGDGELTDSE